MKMLLMLFTFVLVSSAFASTMDEDAATKQLHSQFCALIKASNKKVDVATCTSTGVIVLGGYDSEEVVYQMHKVKLYKNNPQKYYCIVSGPQLLFEGCQKWETVK
jgi:hypothetical protein